MMKYTIEKMDNKIKYYDYDLKKQVSYNTYAFLDVLGRCMIIVGGERRRDLVIEYLL